MKVLLYTVFKDLEAQMISFVLSRPIDAQKRVEGRTPIEFIPSKLNSAVPIALGSRHNTCVSC
jgi:hypothetical protein